MNSIIRILLIIFIYSVTINQGLYISAAEPVRPKVGLVMSGGGAKGVAHISAIKAIEELGIPIDYIAGTSMGSLIGALYSIGYTTSQLDSLVKSQDWSFLLSDRVSKELRSFETKENSGKYIISLPFNQNPKSALGGGFVKGQNLYSLFSELTQGYHDSIDFNQLPIPYACVAENIVTGEEVVFRSGNLAFAMRASMSIPGAFEPIMHNGMALIDGGMVNNYPVSVAKNMGADIIIGVDVQDELKTADELTDVQSVFGQLIALSCQSTFEEARKNTDIYIKVDVKGYSASSFGRSAIDSLLARGDIAAAGQKENLLEIKQKYFSGYTPKQRENKRENKNIFLVEKITFSGLDDIQKEDLMQMCDLYENTFLTKAQIKETISFLYGTLFYSKVSYTLVQNNNGTYNLLFNLAERRENMINVGIRFDTEELAAVTLRTTYHLNSKLPSRIIFNGRLGMRSCASLAYSLNTSLLSNISLSYGFNYNDIYLYKGGERISNVTYRNYRTDLSYKRVLKRSFMLNIGCAYDYYDYNNLLLSDKLPSSFTIDNEHLIDYYASVLLDTTDDRVFPRSGVRARVSGNFYTDNGYKYKDDKPFFTILGDWNWAISPGSKFTIIPGIYARIIAGADDVPLVLSNCFGSNYLGKYVSQQLPFWGMGYTEVAANNVAIASLTMRQRIYDNNFITIRGNILGQSSDIVDFATSDVDYIYGGGIAYSYRTIFGPIEACLGYSSKSTNPYFIFKFGFDF